MSEDTRPRLFCFHHAGAGVSSFARWQRIFGARREVVPVLLPGRDIRAAEPRITDPDRLMAELLRSVGPLLDRPYALYGHSLGALVAHALARTIDRLGLRRPDRVVLGAALPPHLPSSLLPAPFPQGHELLCRLVAQGQLPRQALEEGEDGVWHRRALPVIRDDLKLAAALRAVGGEPLEVPVLAVAGREDAVAPARQIEQWRTYTTAGFALRTVEGGHFFVRAPRLPRLLREELDRPAYASPAAVRPGSSSV
ncbi:thioesterase domain-containing protein [Streptomyces sp. LP05-1]|uniref:Thioesterase domain-containing protein n=1 Tax=Streptomyces pyxinae TaxID=2970734 RepID=A0ABT2CSE8_9ACTN|nr:thioesterase domain-containing protein [Streptomyces sp. LP05-1]MCS0639616.1 thioesterase domain-containing protein [Streptomyces sp. LP05-1]